MANPLEHLRNAYSGSRIRQNSGRFLECKYTEEVPLESWVHMKTITAVTIAACLWLTPCPAVADDARSGLAVGERVSQFLVKDCTGPAAGKTLCYYCRYGRRPVVSVFVREPSDGVGPLIQQIDDAVARHRNQRLAALVVAIGKDTEDSERDLKRYAEERRIRHIPLTIYRDDAAKLRETLKLSPDVTATILLWKDGLVQANLAFTDNRLTKAQIETVLSGIEALVSSKGQ